MNSGLVVHSFTLFAKSSSLPATALFAVDCATMAGAVRTASAATHESSRLVRLRRDMTELLDYVILSSYEGADQKTVEMVANGSVQFASWPDPSPGAASVSWTGGPVGEVFQA